NPGNQSPLEGRTVDPQPCATVSTSPAKEKPGRGIRQSVKQPASPTDRFREREPPASKRNLLLHADRAKRQVCLRFAVEIDRVIRVHVDIIGWFVNERPKRSDCAPSVPLQEHPRF